MIFEKLVYTVYLNNPIEIDLLMNKSTRTPSRIESDTNNQCSNDYYYEYEEYI